MQPWRTECDTGFAKTKVPGSKPINLFFFFDRRKPFFETQLCFRLIILFWIILSCFFVVFFIYTLFILQYFIHFISADTNQRNLVALHCVRPRSRSFLVKGQLAPVLRRRQCPFAIRHQGRDTQFSHTTAVIDCMPSLVRSLMFPIVK